MITTAITSQLLGKLEVAEMKWRKIWRIFIKIANAGGEGAGTLSAVTRAGVSNLRHGQAARADRPAQTRRECGLEKERERGLNPLKLEEVGSEN